MNKRIKLWGMPILITVLTLFGLLSALNGVGIWHWLSWITLGVPILVVTWNLYKARLF